MGFLSSLFKRHKPHKATPFEAFLRSFSSDPNLADKMIRESKPSDRLVMAFCMACLYGGYTLTAELRKSLEELPAIPGALARPPFQFDAVAQEVIAFVFYAVMAEHLDAQDETEDEPESEQLSALKEARYLAESLTAEFTIPRSSEYIKSRILTYSLATSMRKNLFEEGAKRILEAVHSGTNGTLHLERIMEFTIVQHALTADILPAIKRGVNQLYKNWQSNPERFGS